jgi:flavodoxin
MNNIRARLVRDKGNRDFMSNERNEANMGNWKVLTVFYSHSGNTRACANHIHKKVGGDMVEIIPVEPYTEDYEAVVKQAKRELKSGYKPALRTRVENIATYDVIFVGSPNWWNTVAPPVMTFLSEHDLSGKATVPFITHGGSGLGRSVTDIARLCPDATVLEGLAVWGADAKTAQTWVSEWLRKLGMTG